MPFTPPFQTTPPVIDFKGEFLVSYFETAPHVCLLTFNRPKKLNTFWTELSKNLSTFMDWADAEPEIWVFIITGNGRAFSCGGDLEAWFAATQAGEGGISGKDSTMVQTGAAGLSRRVGVTPIIAAVNGLCIGGGCEIAVNCDLVIASEKAVFALPEVRRGLYASQGALNRLVRSVGRQQASEIALLGQNISPARAMEMGFVNKVVPHDQLLPAAFEWAAEICRGSPDAVRLTKMAFNTSLSVADLEESVSKINDSPQSVALSDGDNVKEGMASFLERREPRWFSSKL